MTITKIRIDINQGVLEAEGDEAFVKTIYNDFKERLASHAASTEKNSSEKPPAESPIRKKKEILGKKKKASGGSTSGKMVKDLDLSGVRGAERLKDFYGQYKVKSNYERNLVFVYYLQHRLNIQGITIDHVFTCYRDVGEKVPGALQQSLWDTSKHKGWIDTSSGDNITVTVPGMNYLEHDLKKADSE